LIWIVQSVWKGSGTSAQTMSSSYHRPWGTDLCRGFSLSVSLSAVLLDGWTAWRCWLCWQIYGPTAAGPSGEQAPSWATSSISSLKFRTQSHCNNVLKSKELNAFSPGVHVVCVWCAIFVSVLGLNALLNDWPRNQARK